MPPMVSIDNKTLADGAEEGCENRQIGSLPGHADEDVAKAQHRRDKDQHGIADPRNPAAGHEGVEIGIVGVLGKIADELQWPDAQGKIERHLGAENVAAEPAEAALVIA